MLSFRILDFFIAVLYLSGALSFLLGLIYSSKKTQDKSVLLTIIGFGLHSLDLILKYALGIGEILTQSQFYISLLAWSFLLIYFFLWWRLKLKFLSITAAPLALLIFSGSLAISPTTLPVPGFLQGLWFGLHIGTLFITMALLAMGFGAGLAYLHLDRKIKFKAKLSNVSRDLPSLHTFDRANHLAVIIGFPLYTVGVLSGFIWAAFTWKTIFTWDPKEVATVFIWFIFAWLFHRRVSGAWKGKKPAKMVILLFILSLASFIGINFFIETHHSLRP
ncbi:cytochrome c biogenesis protein CcsA [Desulfonatronovibrio hydrogenovorans]|uniref:cytochrome c biogenesis protein CcsA n=1 Tax=Desulfonatronovibrio hydrogenovorans TaxID=53245 RepID=UPI00048BE4BD|nr:cytochrome c biogenesis protein CcsA [Desulfonatronovibrio hydrogenovorans]